MLTARQRDIAKLMAQGMSCKHAARLLGISPATVRHHRGDILRRLGASRSTNANPRQYYREAVRTYFNEEAQA
jgi:DNA-binding CsgD family transcriptional regulator